MDSRSDARVTFEPDEPYPIATRRIATTELDGALADLDDAAGGELDEPVHSARKRLKRVRALLRLNRPALAGDYARANAAIRDAGRELSPIRDATALAETFAELREVSREELDEEIVAPIDSRLKQRAAEAVAGVEARRRIERARELVAGERARIGEWELSDDPAVLAAGIRRTYARGRKSAEECGEAPTSPALHEWRKRVKHLWTQLELLAPAAPSVLEPLASTLHDLSDALGDDHNLAVLNELLAERPDELGGPAPAQAASAVADAWRAELQRRAVGLGARLYVEDPEAFETRMKGYLVAWRERGRALDTGELTVLAG